MAHEPRIMASFVHGTLEVIDSMGGDLGERVRAGLKPETLEEIENAWSAGWLPLACDLELTSVFFELAGTERACEAMRKNMAETFRKPTMRSITEVAVRIFGLSPGKLFRWGPRVWPLLFKDVGEMHVEMGSAGGTIRFEGLPPEVADDRDYLTGMGAAIAAVFDLTGVQGQCKLAEFGQGEACFELSWKPA